jgi:hypothetical protein
MTQTEKPDDQEMATDDREKTENEGSEGEEGEEGEEEYEIEAILDAQRGRFEKVRTRVFTFLVFRSDASPFFTALHFSQTMR